MGEEYSLSRLIQDELLPIARGGLEKCGIDPKDIDKYLKVIEDRCEGRNGARWQVYNYRKLLQNEKKEDALTHLVRGMYENQKSEKPVSEWEEIQVRALTLNRFVHHHMTTHLFTAHEYDLASMVQRVMEWKNIHHMPVENENGEFAGLITATHLASFADDIAHSPRMTAGEIMVRDLITITPDAPIEKAISIMREHNIGSLPVLRRNELIGLLTTNDLHAYAESHDTASE
jgi:predicted transcriptional regulator